MDLSSLTGLFVGAHVLLAMKLDAPELMISEQEGDDFMTRAQNVLRHYNVETTQKTMDWLAFAACSAGIYVPRVVALLNRRGQGNAPGREHSPLNGRSHPGYQEGGAEIFEFEAAPEPEGFH